MVEAHQAKLEAWSAQGQSCVKSAHGGRSKCHNQVVLDAAAWRDAMPSTIEAFFVQQASTADSIAWARTLHTQFLREYSLMERMAPLVVYDEGSSETPFSLLVEPTQ